MVSRFSHRLDSTRSTRLSSAKAAGYNERQGHKKERSELDNQREDVIEHSKKQGRVYDLVLLVLIVLKDCFVLEFQVALYVHAKLMIRRIIRDIVQEAHNIEEGHDARWQRLFSFATPSLCLTNLCLGIHAAVPRCAGTGGEVAAEERHLIADVLDDRRLAQ